MNELDLISPFFRGKNDRFASSCGSVVTDTDGRSYVDMQEVCVILGQHNLEFTDAMLRALSGVTSSRYTGGPSREQLYSYLMDTTHGHFRSIHFTTSGSEAVDCAVKLAKRITGRSELLTFWNSNHGRSGTSAAISGLSRRKAGYGPVEAGVIYAPYPHCLHCPAYKSKGNCSFECFDMLKSKYEYESAHDCAAVIIEPFQGVGIITPPDGYIRMLYDWAHENGMLFIMDEVQSGVGRTGDMYAYEKLGIQPDMLLLGKGFGNGFHISALLTAIDTPVEYATALGGGVGGDEVSSTAACEVFRQLESGLLDHIRSLCSAFGSGLGRIAAYDCVAQTRQSGTAAAIEFTSEAAHKAIASAMEDAGYLFGNSTNSIVLRPAYSLTVQQADGFFSALERCIRGYEAAQL